MPLDLDEGSKFVSDGGSGIVGVTLVSMLTEGETLDATATWSARGPNPSANVSTWAGSSQ
jgi:hypothetical protein